MRRRRITSACLTLALVSLGSFGLYGQGDKARERVSKITNNLVCTCGCANIIVASCDCGQAAAMRKETAEFVQAGVADADIYLAFEKKYGPAVLGAPKLQGFNVLAWVLPFAGLFAGAIVVVFVVRKLRRKEDPAELEEHPEIDEKYRRWLEEELEE
jgi:cytochrome c-type biogenesis protein CcmH